MRIERLKLRNFKGFTDFDQRLDHRFMLIVGKNGTGKSTLLDALSVAFGGFLLGIPPARVRTIHRKDAREFVRDYDGSLDIVQAFPVIVEVEGMFPNDEQYARKKFVWRRELLSANGRTASGGVAEIRSKAQAIYNDIVNGRDVTLPLLSYFGTGRLWEEPRQSPKSKKSSRFDAYKNSYEAQVSSADLLDWLERQRF